jgi:flagellar hook-associated protein 1 FlgK
VTTSVGNLQQSASGVNIDQETTNILIYQRAYQASSRVLTTVDEMLDTLINHTGTVGL